MMKMPCRASARPGDSFQRNPVLQGHFSLLLPPASNSTNPFPTQRTFPRRKGCLFEPFTAQSRGHGKEKEAARSLVPWKIPASPAAACLWRMEQTQPALRLGKQQGLTPQPTNAGCPLPGAPTGSAGTAEGHPALAVTATA